MLYGEENKAKLRSMAFGYGSKEKGSVIPKYRLNEESIDVPVLTLGVPNRFIAQATVAQQTAECGLDALSIARRIREQLSSMEEASR